MRDQRSPSPDVCAVDITASGGLELDLNETVVEQTTPQVKGRVYMSSKIEGALSYLHTAPPIPQVVKTTGP